MKVRRWNSRLRRAQRAFRRRTSQASSLWIERFPECRGPLDHGSIRGRSGEKSKSRKALSGTKEAVVQVMQEGQTIKHDLFGLGIVTASDQERTAVDFDDHGPKLFVTSMLSAELIGEAPATPPKTKRRRKASTAAKAAKKAAAAAAAK